VTAVTNYSSAINCQAYRDQWAEKLQPVRDTV